MSQGIQEVTTRPLNKKIRLLGQSKLRVNPITLGTMSFGEKWLDNLKLGTPKDEAEKIFLKFIEQGGFTIDTANLYQDGQSEEWIGEFIKKHKINRDDLVLNTKFSLPSPEGKSPNNAGNHKKNLFVSVKNSLKRLQTDYIDVLYVHFHDFNQEGAELELMVALNDLIKQGKVLHLGISDAPSYSVAICNTLAQQHGLEGFTVYQGRHNLVDRSMEHDIFRMCKRLNLATTPWSVLAAGKLARFGNPEDYKDSKRTDPNNKFTEKELKVKELVVNIAKKLKCNPMDVVLAWSMQKTTTILIGPRTVKHLEGNLKALDVELSKEDMDALDQASAIDLPFPYNFIGQGEGNFLHFLTKEPWAFDQ